MGFGKSSQDKPDLFYRVAKEEGWRARSAFKLMHLNKRYEIFRGVRKVVDLCAAPGSWSQALVAHLKPWRNHNAKIVAVDIQAMAPLRGVTTLQGDITKESTAEKIILALGSAKAELVVCDGAPDITGLYDLDDALHSELLTCALNIATFVLRNGGTFVAKIFEGDDLSFLISQIRVFFKEMVISKPPSSRDESIETFIVCKHYTPPEGYVPSMWNSLKHGRSYNFMNNKANAKYIPFLLSGDLTNYDTDRKHSFVKSDFMNYVSREPVKDPVEEPFL